MQIRQGSVPDTLSNKKIINYGDEPTHTVCREKDKRKGHKESYDLGGVRDCTLLITQRKRRKEGACCLTLCSVSKLALLG